jgi:hypothetical protein
MESVGSGDIATCTEATSLCMCLGYQVKLKKRGRVVIFARLFHYYYFVVTGHGVLNIRTID